VAEEKKDQKTTEFAQGTVLFRQGSKGGDLYFIIEGSVELTVRDEVTGKETVVARPGARSILGTMSFLESEPRSATAKCVSAVKAIVVSPQQREKLLTQVPEWFKALLKDMSANLRRTNEEFAKASARNEILERRVAIMKAKLGEADEDAPKKPEAKAEKSSPQKPEQPATSRNVKGDDGDF
jgi:CRP/FNR family cyclic AMP-dependent transcriptional regulator